jgi:hypothetical protein
MAVWTLPAAPIIAGPGLPEKKTGWLKAQRYFDIAWQLRNAAVLIQRHPAL